MKKALPYLLATILTGFGLLTLFLSTSVIFDLFGIRAKEGNYVLFVVWSNFISSILYLIASYGFVTSKKWTAKLLALNPIKKIKNEKFNRSICTNYFGLSGEWAVVHGAKWRGFLLFKNSP